jgi:beta-lactamase regulating signal transducer with metallopeptidase domain
MLWINISQLDGNMLVQALFRTFLHSLWEGVVVAILASIVIFCTRKAPASLRYNLFASLLILFLCAVTVTFIFQLGEFHVSAVYGAGTAYIHSKGLAEVHIVEHQAVTGSVFQVPVIQSISERFNVYMDRWAPFLMGAWALIFLARCAQLTTAFYQIHRLRHTAIKVPDEEWIARTRQLAARLGINKPVRLLESGLAKTPLTIGYFSPMILMPIGVLCRLPADQLNAILLHELGHIRRHDYLVNLLQYLTEAIFFFNPATLWLSVLLKKERECCCDDLVLLHSDNRKSYFDALLSFYDYQAGRLAMPLGSNANPLLSRIQRMVSQQNNVLNGAEKMLLLLGVIVISAFGFIGKKDKNGAPFFAGPISQSTQNKQVDTVPARADTSYGLPPGPENFTGISKTESDDGLSVVAIYEATDNTGKKYILHEKDRQLTDLSIDGRAIPRDQLENYVELIPFINRILEIRASHIPKEWEESTLKMERLAVHFTHQEQQASDEIKDPEKLKAREDQLTREFNERVTRLQAVLQKTIQTRANQD